MPESVAHSSNTPNRLGADSIARLLVHYSLPAIVGMTATSLYNVVDRIFIGNGVGPLAIAGLALTMPIMNLTAAFGAMIGAGASTTVSIRLGQQRHQDAVHTLGNTLVLNFIIGFGITFFGLVFLEPILILFGASPATLPFAKDFMQIILLANLFNHNFIGLNNVMRASGYPKKAMWSSILTVLVNIGLAPVFIFAFGWGIRGAALATALAQLVGFVWVMFHFMNPSSFLHFQKGTFRLKKRIVKDIISIGLSPFLIHTTASLVAVVINVSLGYYGGTDGDLAIGAYGIINSIILLFLMIVMGLNMGMQPIAGYNFGAQKMDRVVHVYKLTMIAASIVTIVGFLLAMLFPTSIVGLFTDHAPLRDLSASAMRIAMIVFPIVGFQMVTTNFFQSIGKVRLSIFLSLSRQLIFLIPGLILFPRMWGLTGVWIAIPFGDFCASLVTLFVILKQYKQLVRQGSRF